MFSSKQLYSANGALTLFSLSTPKTELAIDGRQFDETADQWSY
jgi:hypothetical protein